MAVLALVVVACSGSASSGSPGQSNGPSDAPSIVPTPPTGEALGALEGASDGPFDWPGDPLEAEPEQATTTRARTPGGRTGHAVTWPPTQQRTKRFHEAVHGVLTT